MRFYKELLILIALAITIAVPFVLAPKGDGLAGNPNIPRDTLVVITPHNETIQQEFTQAFTRWYLAKNGRTVVLDWRKPGGTSEISMFLRSEYLSMFRVYWTQVLKKPWEPVLDNLFRKDLPALKPARDVLLQSNVGVGIDVFFGGGSFDFMDATSYGMLVSADPSGKFGLKPLSTEHPDWFTDEIMPAKLDGEIFRDTEFRWTAGTLSSFGICYNRDVLKRLGIAKPPQQWADLADPAYIGQIALADPTKSGSVTKAYEMIIQQQISEAIQSGMPEPEAIAEGWKRGISLIQRISANGRYFTDAATKIPHDVASGDAAAGMCIDFYGRTYNQKLMKADGNSRLVYLTPAGGSAVSADPIGMLRGAPHPMVAHAFLEFVLSAEGQKLWNYRVGQPGGPKDLALRRMPVRKDLYTPENLANASDPDALPYQGHNLVYNDKWTGKLFSVLKLVVQATCVDNHHELKAAWQSVVNAGASPLAVAELLNPNGITYPDVLAIMARIKQSPDKASLIQAEITKDLTLKFRAQYRHVKAMVAGAK